MGHVDGYITVSIEASEIQSANIGFTEEQSSPNILHITEFTEQTLQSRLHRTVFAEHPSQNILYIRYYTDHITLPSHLMLVERHLVETKTTTSRYNKNTNTHPFNIK